VGKVDGSDGKIFFAFMSSDPTPAEMSQSQALDAAASDADANFGQGNVGDPAAQCEGASTPESSSSGSPSSVSSSSPSSGSSSASSSGSSSASSSSSSSASSGSSSSASSSGSSSSSSSCWLSDYTKQINQPSYARYFRKYKADGTEYTSLPPKFAGKIYVPLTGNTITVELRFKPEAHGGVLSFLGVGSVSDADVNSAKSKLESGVATNWNGKFTLVVDDPLCGKKSFAVVFKIAWVTSGQDYTIVIHDTYDREGVTGVVMDVSKSTDNWIYAHEVGHCFGLPDEYAYKKPAPETVKYIKPDGSLDAAVSAPYNGKDKNLADATIMAAKYNTTVLPRHGWSVAIEVQALLTEKLGRAVKCSIS
jgi:hypothetical protein